MMRTTNWLAGLAIVVAAGYLFSGCGSMRKLAKQDPQARVQLPARRQAEPPQEHHVDTTTKVISFRKQDGSEVFFAPIVVDSLTGEKLMSVAIDEVVISAGSRRNLVERNGKINIEFIVTVPEVLQDVSWNLRLDPQLSKGPEVEPLDPLIYSGERFRIMQERQYNRYNNYVARIVDSTDYFVRFGRDGYYKRHMNHVAEERVRYTDKYGRLLVLNPEQAICDKQVGWLTPRERRRQFALLRDYVRTTDQKASRRVNYTPNSNDPYDHLNDYFAPRHRYGEIEVLPGGEVYTRVNGRYTDPSQRRREAYFRTMADSISDVRRKVRKSNRDGVRALAANRMIYVGRDAMVEGLLVETSDSATKVNYQVHRDFAADQLALLSNIDTAAIRQGLLRRELVERNQQLLENKERAFSRMVRHPYPEEPRLDTVIRAVNGSLEYHYVEEVTADENTSKIHLYLAGGLESRGGRSYSLSKSDTLTFNVASMTTFLDETPRYMQRVITRDAEANARFFFVFPSGRTKLDTLRENRRQVAEVRNLTRSLMTDPIYLIDSITLRATASPEGAWGVNDRLARERAEALRRVMVAEFRVLYDSLKIAASVTLDDQGRQVWVAAHEDLPDLPNLLRTKWLAEDWDRLYALTAADQQMPNREQVLELIGRPDDLDQRESKLRSRFPKAYNRIRQTIYPQLRAVDFRFNLHRRGMQQDTIYTTELDSNYMQAVELLRKRRYEPALEILRAYEDRNTALAYMSLGYDAAAYRILQGLPEGSEMADVQYMLAILASRLGNEQEAVQSFMRAVELRENLKFRGNLDPEIARLIRKYGLFQEDFS